VAEIQAAPKRQSRLGLALYRALCILIAGHRTDGPFTLLDHLGIDRRRRAERRNTTQDERPAVYHSMT
jgi:hypothetical protein